MSNNERPASYASDEKTERALLAALPWTGTRQAAYCKDTRNPIERVRSEMRRVYASEMRNFDGQIMTELASLKAAESAKIASDIRAAAERAEQQDSIARAMGTGAYAPNAKLTTTFDSRTQIQTFGVGVAR